MALVRGAPRFSLFVFGPRTPPDLAFARPPFPKLAVVFTLLVEDSSCGMAPLLPRPGCGERERRRQPKR